MSHGSGSGAAGGPSGASKSYSTFQTSPAFGGPASLEPHSGMDQYGRDLMGDEGRFGALFGTPLGRDSPGRADAHHGHEDSMQGMQPRCVSMCTYACVLVCFGRLSTCVVWDPCGWQLTAHPRSAFVYECTCTCVCVRSSSFATAGIALTPKHFGQLCTARYALLRVTFMRR